MHSRLFVQPGYAVKSFVLSSYRNKRSYAFPAMLLGKAVKDIFGVAMQRMSENYKMDAEQIKTIMGEAGMAQMKADMAVQEAVDFLVAEAKLV